MVFHPYEFSDGQLNNNPEKTVYHTEDIWSFLPPNVQLHAFASSTCWRIVAHIRYKQMVWLHDDFSCEHLASFAEDKLSDTADIWRVLNALACVAIRGSKGCIW